MRNVNAVFLRQVLRGDKKLLKKADLVSLGKLYGFRNLATGRILQNFPDLEAARQHLPDLEDFSKVDRTFVLTVVSIGFEHT